jgi:hypothetical protein
MRHGIFAILTCVFVIATPVLAGNTDSEISSAVGLLPKGYRADVVKALKEAGDNSGELIKAINSVSPEQREGAAFLLANMPPRDLRGLSSSFLVENIRLAYQVLNEVPWGQRITKDIFLNYVLPYVNVNERRDNWRADFHGRFLPIALESGSIKESVRGLNKKVFQILNVKYHAKKRPKPDQSPYESQKARYASCTGLSILLVDALRSVGIPSRITAVCLWVDKSGNHTWVEVWDGSWHHIGAAEPDEYDQAWFNSIAARADESKPEHKIYAASFKKTGLLMPLAWDETIDYVYAVDVTSRYKGFKGY